MLSQERAAILGKFLTDDPERANKLFELPPEEATAEINKQGYDFTVDEVKEFGENLKKVGEKQGELGENELEEVSGGIAVAAATFYFTVFAGCALIGKDLAKTWKW